jgi:2-dehydropantoate 2-reductase
MAVDVSPTRLVVVGTGAMACLVGARLARGTGARVTLCGTWPDALTALAAHGAVVEEDGRRWSAPVTVARLDGGGLPEGDVVLVLTKATRTAEIADAALRMAGRSGLVVTLQNGLGNREILEAAGARGRVVSGVALFGATLLAPGVVRPTPGGIVLGGEPATRAAVERLAERLRAADFPTEVTAEIATLVWRKLAVNCAINPVSAVLGVTNGALLDDEEARRTLVAAAEEVAAVARAEGVSVTGAEAVELTLRVARQTAANRSSMLQDLDRRARTEIDALCGEVLRRGVRLGVPTPVNARLWADVRRLERAPAHALPVP